MRRLTGERVIGRRRRGRARPGRDLEVGGGSIHSWVGSCDEAGARARCTGGCTPPLPHGAADGDSPSSLSSAASSSHCLVLAADHGSAMDGGYQEGKRGRTSSPSQAALADEHTRMSSS